jgi:starvation-inducible DNA-binding protein
MIPLLNRCLADAVALASHVRSAHWNVKGPQFIGLHKLFEEIYEGIDEHIDMIAERCVQLGGTALGTVRIAADTSELPEYPTDIFTCQEHVAEVSKRLAHFGEKAREAAERAESVDDIATNDLFTEISRTIDKSLWFVEAHEQADR